MDFDYKQTQAQVTYRLVGTDDWAFKEVAATGGTDTRAGPENQLFEVHRAEMSDAGWTLVSMAASPSTLQLIALKVTDLSRTSNYELSWKRIKAPTP
jgi:hypothetical protein